MRTALIKLVVALSVGFIPSRATAETPEPRPRAAAANTRHLAPFVGPETIFVAHIHLGKVEPQAVEQWLLEVVRSTAADNQAMTEQVRGALGAARHWTANLKKAGADHVYLIVSNATQQASQQASQEQSPLAGPPSIALVVPLDEGDDAETISKLLRPSNGQDLPFYAESKTKVMHGAVVLASEPTLQRLSTGVSGDATAVSQALQSIDGAPAQLAFRPTGYLQSAVAAIASSAPEAVRQSAGQLELDRNVEWASLGLQLPQQQAVKLVIRARSADAANRLAEQINQLLQSAPEGKEPADRSAAQQAANLQSFQPKVTGDRLTVTLTGAQATSLTKQALGQALQELRKGPPTRAKP